MSHELEMEPEGDAVASHGNVVPKAAKEPALRRPTRRSFTRPVRIPPAGTVVGIVVQFHRTRSRLKDVRLEVDGRPVPDQVYGAFRDQSGIVFELRWKQAATIAPTAKVTVSGRYRGGPPSEVRIAWLGSSGLRLVDKGREVSLPLSSDAGSQRMFHPDAAAEVAQSFVIEFARSQGLRLRDIARVDDSVTRIAAAFFLDLDLATHPDAMSEAKADAIEHARDQLEERYLARAKSSDGVAFRLPVAEAESLLKALEEVRVLLIDLLRSHFPTGQDFYAYDRELAARAVWGFMLREHPIADSVHGAPDSTYYFCFAELLALFGEGVGGLDRTKERRYWLPLLQVFVDTSAAFAEIYHDGRSHSSKSYRAETGRLFFEHDEERRACWQARAETHVARLIPASANVDAEWDDALLRFGATVREALADDLVDPA